MSAPKAALESRLTIEATMGRLPHLDLDMAWSEMILNLMKHSLFDFIRNSRDAEGLAVITLADLGEDSGELEDHFRGARWAAAKYGRWDFANALLDDARRYLSEKGVVVIGVVRG